MVHGIYKRSAVVLATSMAIVAAIDDLLLMVSAYMPDETLIMGSLLCRDCCVIFLYYINTSSLHDTLSMITCWPDQAPVCKKI